MKAIWQLYKKSFQLFKEHFNVYVGYQIIINIVLGFILIPVFQIIFNFLMKNRGYRYITDGLLFKFLISPQGLILAIVSLFLGALVLLVEVSGLIILTHQLHFKKVNTSYYGVIHLGLKKVKRLLSVNGLLILFYFIIIVPLIDNNIKDRIFSSLRVPNVISSMIRSSLFHRLLIFIIVLLIIYFIGRWIFALHVLILGEDDDQHFLKNSYRIIKGRLKMMMTYFLFTTLIQVFFILIFLFVSLGISNLLLYFFSEMPSEWMLTILTSLGIILTLILSSVLLPMSIIRLTFLYYELSHQPSEALNLHARTRKKLNRWFSKKIVWLLFIAVVIIGTMGYSITVYHIFENTMFDVEVTAHRGSSKYAPENTLSAIELAIMHGTEFAEIDVQSTKDGTVILLHDSTFERTAGLNKRPSQVTYNEVMELDVGAWYGMFYSEYLPTLEQVIQATTGRIKLNIEIKASRYYPEVVDEVLSLIEKYDYYDSCVVTSVNLEDLIAIEEKMPEVKTGYIMFKILKDLKDVDVDFYSIKNNSVTEDFIANAHKLGREVHVWTVNTKNTMDKMLDLGVDNIITDDDLKLRRLINARLED